MVHLKKWIFLSLSVSTLAFSACNSIPIETIPSNSDLNFTEIPNRWDEAIPLGNGTVGALVWQRDSCLRMSLDRTDLWDLQPIEAFSHPDCNFAWILEQVNNNTYEKVQNSIDHIYDQVAAPTKIPGAALEFSLKELGKPQHIRLFLKNAVCQVNWDNGTTLKTFVHATRPMGCFVFENLNDTITPHLIAPKYESEQTNEGGNGLSGMSLERLGYKQGKVIEKDNEICYHQKGWNDYYYDVNVRWKREGDKLYGVWSLTSSLVKEKAEELTKEGLQQGLANNYKEHANFWNKYWTASSISIPDSVLQKQYDNEMYKFGSATREHSYPISLQAVWTADDGNLPPWKGDYHHDLNTQLSYWPTYASNHLQEGLGYLNTLWEQRDVYRKYTRQFFNCKGLNVPGVCSLNGEPLGGWSQYTFSPTVSAWLAQHFYLHWKYSADQKFLQERAYPFTKEVAEFLEDFSFLDENGIRQFPLSSSPEVRDNSVTAWFRTMTNYDLALSRFTFKAAAEMATALNLQEEAEYWKKIENQFPEYDLDEEKAMTFAKGQPYNFSHRHLSNLMAIHPLGLIDYSQGEESQKIIQATIEKLEKMGPAYWVGYSYSWYGNLLARAFDGEGAAKALKTFAECFCLKNTFHVNGDQTRTGKSAFTYRPFTLEGNFAFAAGIQEMLIQSHTETIHIFPAIPETWKNVAFENLRTRGAFLVSAKMVEGEISEIKIKAEHGGVCKIKLPQSWNNNYRLSVSDKTVTLKEGVLEITTTKGQEVDIYKPNL